MAASNTMSWKDDHEKRIAAFPAKVRDAHKHSIGHRAEIMASTRCGCFFCCASPILDESALVLIGTIAHSRSRGSPDSGLRAYRSSGVRPVRLARRANMRGPISSLS